MPVQLERNALQARGLDVHGRVARTILVRAGVGERQRRIIGQDRFDGTFGDLAGRADDLAASVDDARGRYRAGLRGRLSLRRQRTHRKRLLAYV